MAKVLTASELAHRLPDPAFSEATGVLEMIARDPDQRSLYEERLKFERDVRAKEDHAREEGRQEGEAIGMMKGEAIGMTKGEVIGKIKLLCDLLGQDPPGETEFQSHSPDDLASMEQDLQRRLRERS